MTRVNARARITSGGNRLGRLVAGIVSGHEHINSHTNLVSAPACAGPSDGHARSRWAALPIVLAGTFMVVLDFFIVNVALPSMQTHLHASAGSVEWVVAGYSLTSAVFLITGSRLGDRYGRRRCSPLGLAVFTLASAGCGVAPSATALVVARLAQGVGAAALMPNVLALIGALYDGPDRAPGAVGLRHGDGPGRGRRPAAGRRAARRRPGRAGWRTVLPDQPPDRRSARWRWRGRSCPSHARRQRRPARRRRHRAGHRCRDRDRAAAGRRPGARLAAVDVAVAGRRRRCCWRRSRCSSAGWRRGAAATRCWRPRCSRHGRSPPAWPGSSCSGAARRRSSWCWRCTCSRAAG